MNLNKRNIPLSIIFWLFAVAVAVVIFGFSADSAEKSDEISQGLLSVIIEYIGNIISHNTLRKIAHFTEFAALGFFVGGGIRFSFLNDKISAPLIPCMLYAFADEIHQFYIPDRACRIFDVLVDTLGSLTGILIFALFIGIIAKIKEKKRR